MDIALLLHMRTREGMTPQRLLHTATFVYFLYTATKQLPVQIIPSFLDPRS